MVREEKNYSGSQNGKSNGLEWNSTKFFAEVKTEKGQALPQVYWLELEQPFIAI